MTMSNEYLIDFINTGLKNLQFSQDKIGEAMRYTIIDDGAKRIRPLLFMLVCKMLEKDLDKALNYALAIELIHNYSLVHDDLECMDNDDYRRGKFTVHKKYGEDIAVLVGDALLNFSFELLTESMENSNDIKCSNYIVKNSGCNGMIRGQLMDIDYDITKDNIIEIYDKKTCYMLKAAVVGAGYWCGLDDESLKLLEEYTFNLGMAFQIIDDIMDYDNDVKIGKKTYVTIFGKEKSKTDANLYSENAIKIIQKFQNSDELIQLTQKLLN